MTHFLDMSTTTSATAEAIFNVMDHKLVSLLDEDNPWLRCTSFGEDNTSVNIGSRNSLKTLIKLRTLLFILVVAILLYFIMQLKKQVKCLLKARTLILKISNRSLLLV